MKKILLGIVLILTGGTLFAEVLLQNELAFSKPKYLSYSLAAMTGEKPYTFIGNLNLSGSSDHNSAFGIGAEADYDYNDGLTLNFAYNYAGNTSYPVYETEYTVTPLKYLVSLKQALKANTITPSFTGIIDFFTFAPGCEVTFNDLAGYLEVQSEQGLKASTSKLTAEKDFNQYVPKLSLTFRLPEDFKINAGGGRDYYGINTREVLDSEGSTITANKEDNQNALLKSAITFNDYNLSFGITKKIDKADLGLSCTYTKYVTPTYEVYPDHMGGLILSFVYNFSDVFDAGVKLEGDKTAYTDGSTVNSGYLDLDVDFTLGAK